MNKIYTNHDNKINVVLYSNKFSESGKSHYGRISRNMVSQEQLIKGILGDNENTNTGLNAYILSFAMDRMKSRILEEIKAGNAVNLLDLGTMYLTLRGSFDINKDNADASALKGKKLSVAFTPSDSVLDAVDKLKVGSVSFCIKAPVINSMVNLSSKKETFDFAPGSGIELQGSKLKLMGEKSGIWLVPVKADGSMEETETEWIKISADRILKNYPKSLIFILPENLEAGKKYVIAVRTQFCAGSTTLKSPVTGFSSEINII